MSEHKPVTASSGGDRGDERGANSEEIREAVHAEAIELLGEIDDEGVAPSGDTTSGERKTSKVD